MLKRQNRYTYNNTEQLCSVAGTELHQPIQQNFQEYLSFSNNTLNKINNRVQKTAENTEKKQEEQEIKAGQQRRDKQIK